MTSYSSEVVSVSSPVLFSRRRVRLGKRRALKVFSSHSFLYERVCRSLWERVQDCQKSFTKGIVVGQRDSSLFSFPFSPVKTDSVHHRDLDVVFDEEFVPFAPRSFDIILSPLTFHWVNDLPGSLSQFYSTLEPGGFFLGALIGGESLCELRTCFLKAESEKGSGVAERVAPLIDPSTLGGLLRRAGFEEPLIDIDRLTLKYRHLLDLFEDLRGMGETYKGFYSFPLNRSLLEKTETFYRQNFSQESYLLATLDIIYFSAWRPTCITPPVR